MSSSTLSSFVDQLLDLHQLALIEKDGEDTADAIRARLESVWSQLSEAEQRLTTGLSADLYTLGTTAAVPATVPHSFHDRVTKLLAAEAPPLDDWCDFLEQLRSTQASVAADQAAYLRARAFLALGLPRVALEFVDDACRLDSGRDEYRQLQRDLRGASLAADPATQNPFRVFPLPNFRGSQLDLIFCNPQEPNSNGALHYAFAVAGESDALERRLVPWTKVRDFAQGYGKEHPEVVARIQARKGYWPGEDVLSSESGADFATDQHTVIKLGALELLANVSSGRLSTNEKDPFPHQLALQQHMRGSAVTEGTRRVLIADEVGLGKTIESGLVLRDILVARGRLDKFSCLYVTSGGLVDDAATKLRSVLGGVVDGQNIVQEVDSFRAYGKGTIFGVHVASMHAARLYTQPKKKSQLPEALVAPDIVIIDECHHAASEGVLAGVANLQRTNATVTYVAAKQLITGEFWPNSKPPSLVILMSATPFRSHQQFLNLLRLLLHGVKDPRDSKDTIDAFDRSMSASALTTVLRSTESVSVVWRLQTDPGVRSWSGGRLFPNLRIVRPHQVDDANGTPRLAEPSATYLELMERIKASVKRIAMNHESSFGGFATAQLEKRLTSSSIAGACWLFSWAVRHSRWESQKDYRADTSPSTQALRDLIKGISARLAQFDVAPNAPKHATVEFASERFVFEAKSLAQAGAIDDVQRFNRKMLEDDDAGFVATADEIALLASLGHELLEVGRTDAAGIVAENAKLDWLNRILDRHPEDRFLVFTESLQTCATVQSALGARCRILVGSMSPPLRKEAVAAFRSARSNVRVLIATSAADEGFDLQVANRIVHWDLSSSPATLMQRNGRVARLGQVADVTAYYLILRGTHEERRDSALQQKFAELGIDDESVRSRILGSLSAEEEARLEQAIEENDEAFVGDLLRTAADENRKMDDNLRQIRTSLEAVHVLSRTDLAERLDRWRRIGLPESTEVAFDLERVPWQRPVFGEVTRAEPATAMVGVLRPRDKADKRHEDVAFDAEFLLFGPGARDLHLAGLRPWSNEATRHGVHKIGPWSDEDFLGRLLSDLARSKRGDFMVTGHAKLVAADARLAAARWLLFCTHPLRERENVLPTRRRPYLTYYAFSEAFLRSPIHPDGAGAAEVHRVLNVLEEQILSGENLEPSPEQVAHATQVGQRLGQWVSGVARFGAAAFMEEERYFVPIPVALVMLLD